MIAALVDYLAMFYQTGNMEQMEVVARSMLAAIPDDVVALQFLGLALYQMGYVDRAHKMFKRVADKHALLTVENDPTLCESASVVSYREATRPHSGLADALYRIAMVLNRFGLHKPATRAFAAALTAGGAKEAATV